MDLKRSTKEKEFKKMNFDDDEDEQCNSIELVVSDGKATLKPETVEIPVDDFNQLNVGLTLLKKRYPDIHKECFP